MRLLFAPLTGDGVLLWTPPLPPRVRGTLADAIAVFDLRADAVGAFPLQPPSAAPWGRLSAGGVGRVPFVAPSLCHPLTPSCPQTICVFFSPPLFPPFPRESPSKHPIYIERRVFFAPRIFDNRIPAPPKAHRLLSVGLPRCDAYALLCHVLRITYYVPADQCRTLSLNVTLFRAHISPCQTGSEPKWNKTERSSDL